jgi:hypothetical protein
MPTSSLQSGQEKISDGFEQASHAFAFGPPQFLLPNVFRLSAVFVSLRNVDKC